MSSLTLNRRTLLLGAAACGALAALRLNTSEAPGSAWVVVEEANESSLRFAEAYTRAGAIPLLLDGDVMHFWRNRLLPAVTEQRRPVAGLSSWLSYLALRSCAPEAELRVRHEARHDSGAVGTVHAVKSGPLVDTPQWAAQLARLEQAEWPEAVARALLGAAARPGAARLSATLAPGAASQADTTLISWLMV